jgi:hypothetical protein
VDGPTIEMVDDLFVVLGEPWRCAGGYEHAPNTLCLHPLSEEERARILDECRGLRQRLMRG